MIVIDLDNNLSAYGSFTNRSPLTSITRKRRDTYMETVVFLRQGRQAELASGSTGILGIKEKGKYGNAYSAAALSWEKQGNGQETTYLFSCPLNVSGINDFFPNNTTASVQLALEISWVENGTPFSTPGDILFFVKNDYIQGEETAPSAGPPNLANWGNESFRFGSTGEPEWYSSDLTAWVRVTLTGNPPQLTYTVLP